VKGELRVRVIHIPRSKIPGSFMEIGDNGVYIMVITFSGKKAALVIIDGNNIKSALADEIRRRLEEFGYIAEVATTDNHQYTGFFGKMGYRVVGDGVSQSDLTRLILNAVKGGETEETEVSYVEFEDKVRVVGSDGFYGITRAASSAVKLLPLHASLLFLAPIVLSIVATYLILH
jgi:putative membrane protein